MTARTVLLRAYTKFWTAAVAACLLALVVGALVFRQSFRLTALSDIIQSLLLLSGTLSLIPQALRARGRLRLFWTLLATGIGFWFLYQLFWTYFEVWLRQDVPNLFVGDIVLFVHIVPLMAALALRPHAPQDAYAAHLRRLDFALLLIWWVYLYVLAVIPWQYVVPDVVAYGHNLNLLYLIEKVAYLSVLVLAWKESRGVWRAIYGSLFGACITYGASSYLANWALARHSYYSGSLYDIPLAVSMTWITVIGLWSREPEAQPTARIASTAHGVWLARLGMIAAFSLPLFAGWALLDGAIPAPIRSFRVVLTLATALLMGAMVFARQRLLDRELVRLLTESRESFANLKRLQVQITESEKLASIGQLVGGAAHELNNPIAAMLGYSDLLQITALNPEQHELAEKIGQHVRRTKSLVGSLLSFAKQGPAAMAPVDLGTILRTAVKLTQPQWQALKIEVHAEVQTSLPLVLGDSNQLLQVCVQILNNALHTADRRTARTLAVTAQHKDGLAVIEISDSGAAANPNQKEEDHSLSNLGLSACQGILKQHHGRIVCQQDWTSGATIRIEIPVIPRAQGKSTGVGVPAMRQPQPFA